MFTTALILLGTGLSTKPSIEADYRGVTVSAPDGDVAFETSTGATNVSAIMTEMSKLRAELQAVSAIANFTAANLSAIGVDMAQLGNRATELELSASSLQSWRAALTESMGTPTPYPKLCSDANLSIGGDRVVALYPDGPESPAVPAYCLTLEGDERPVWTVIASQTSIPTSNWAAMYNMGAPTVTSPGASKYFWQKDLLTLAGSSAATIFVASSNGKTMKIDLSELTGPIILDGAYLKPLSPMHP